MHINLLSKGVTMILGYTTGVFDLFHIGHLKLLRNAKSLCDKLIVGVTTDELIMTYKGKRSIIPFSERIEIIRNIKCVDVAIAQENMDKYAVWEKIKYDIMFVGDDWYNNPKWIDIEAQFKNVGVRIVYFPYTKTTSSTLINKILLEQSEKIDKEKLGSQ
jgi:glycerol-3-phosphate cytidylyltransferase